MPVRRVQGMGAPERPAPHLVDEHRPEYPTRSWLEALEVEKGYTPQGLDEMRKAEPAQLDAAWPTLKPGVERTIHGPDFEPYLALYGYHLPGLATRLHQLLADGKWHSYAEVCSLFKMDSWPERGDFYRVMVWGDMPHIRSWQVPIYCHGKGDGSGFYALWDATVAVEHRKARKPEPASERTGGWACRYCDWKGSTEGLKLQNGKGPWLCPTCGKAGLWTGGEEQPVARDSKTFVSSPARHRAASDFPCCGGSDEDPPNHTQDCSGPTPAPSPAGLTRTEAAAYQELARVELPHPLERFVARWAGLKCLICSHGAHYPHHCPEDEKHPGAEDVERGDKCWCSGNGEMALLRAERDGKRERPPLDAFFADSKHCGWVLDHHAPDREPGKYEYAIAVDAQGTNLACEACFTLYKPRAWLDFNRRQKLLGTTLKGKAAWSAENGGGGFSYGVCLCVECCTPEGLERAFYNRHHFPEPPEAWKVPDEKATAPCDGLKGFFIDGVCDHCGWTLPEHTKQVKP